MKKTTIIQSTGFKVTAMVVFIAVTAFTLNQYVQLIKHLITINYNWQFELLMVTGMLFFQYPFILKKAGKLKLDYYYNMLLVSFMGAFLLVPLLFLNQYGNHSDQIQYHLFFYRSITYVFRS